MKERKIMDQLGVIFGAFMTLFYVGVGLYLALSPNLYFIDKSQRTIVGIVGFTFTFYGVYRGFRTYQRIVEVFFSRGDDEE